MRPWQGCVDAMGRRLGLREWGREGFDGGFELGDGVFEVTDVFDTCL